MNWLKTENRVMKGRQVSVLKVKPVGPNSIFLESAGRYRPTLILSQKTESFREANWAQGDSNNGIPN